MEGRLSDLAKKLQLKADRIRVVNAPADVDLDLPVAERAPDVLVFVRDRADLEAHAAAALEVARADGLAWIAYPKGGQLGTDLNRDILWEALEGVGVRPVRQVAIDEVWSALRFRPE
jgi:hypothetical protein